ncbi:hypothetical protein [Butyrivibrio sp. INlla16]|uniref:hypothetical protein n=1 Tax=Butyrivibrio sp. INlla16 TaxID=1520807 RepID=UPI000889561B|nr:hypothetical protein [Butyrivibrio sp. INlla16]SDB50935.1 hypothetical protein SAMN02910263_02560 [Butyrivibrio sp. INlla16]
MTNKNTKAKKTIEKLGLLYGVSYDDKTYKNIKKILECYREYAYEQVIFDFTSVETKDIRELIFEIYRGFTSKYIISDKLVNTIVVHMINDCSISEILDKTLEDIKSFRAEGDDYNYILKQLYFTHNHSTNTDIYLDLELSSTQYSYRKEEAIMIFWIFFWQECLKKWDITEVDMHKVVTEAMSIDLLKKYDVGQKIQNCCVK